MTAMDINTPATRTRPKVMSLTDAAADRIKSLMAKSGKEAAGLVTEYAGVWSISPTVCDHCVAA